MASEVRKTTAPPAKTKFTGKATGPRFGGEDDPTDTSGGQVHLALLRSEAFEGGMGAGAARTGRAIHLTTLEERGCRIERDSEPAQAPPVSVLSELCSK